ncbi:cytosine permease [Companilactobacillus baiquanensis]|uniref:Cytosine permease n=1 Tax=Companilactobacillus baiquanensis TaxID=2486005 RepID=A0ABW1UTW1_9LACO|nr:cytosine permease [Companilactobacillus baiquanensis]
MSKTVEQTDIYHISDEKYKEYADAQSNEEMLPLREDKRTMGFGNYFTLWMGGIHNIATYATVAGFLLLGAPMKHIILAIFLSFIFSAYMDTLNGRAGSKYGIPGSMHLKSVYGDRGAKLPGILRGIFSGLAWFSLQIYTGSRALYILIAVIWPSFESLGGNFNFIGINLPNLISFILYWVFTLLIGLGGSNLINKFNVILNPLIYIFFIGAAIWALNAAGGFGNILSFTPPKNLSYSYPTILVYFMIFNSLLGFWSSPAVNVADYTKNAKSNRAQSTGMTLGFGVGYLIFAFSSVIILAGGALRYGVTNWADFQQFGILSIMRHWSQPFAIIGGIIVLLMATVSANVLSNGLSATYQLIALFPKRFSYKTGMITSAIIAFILIPWKTMTGNGGVMAFMNMIGVMLGPVVGVMLAYYFVIDKRKLDLDSLYLDKVNPKKYNRYAGINKNAYIATIIAIIITMLGYIHGFEAINQLSVFVGAGLGFLISIILPRSKDRRVQKSN